MQVAVPRVEHVAHDQLMGGGDAADGLEHVGERGARPPGVLHQEIAVEAAHGAARGTGWSRPGMPVEIPKLPSEPTNTPTRSGPHGSPPGLPSSTTAPVASTTSSASTWFAVTPYFRQWGPPEFSATLPPSVHALWLEGSGA